MSSEKKSKNFAAWAIDHKILVYFFAFLTFVMGLFSFKTLGRSEDPAFPVKMMIISAAWPGATAQEVEEHLTNTIEKEAQNLPQIKFITSYSRPGVSVIKVVLKDEAPTDQTRQRWLELRNMINDIKGNLPSGTYGPYFNDRFDDVYGNIYALTGDDFSYEEKRKIAEKIRMGFLGIKDVKKVVLVGTQQEKIFLEMESAKLAQMGLDLETLAGTITAQTGISASGMLEAEKANVYLRVTGLPDKVEELRTLPVNANGKVFRLGDFANIRRAYEDPPSYLTYFNGKPCVSIAVSMEEGGDNIALGKNLDAEIARIRKDLPLGLSLDIVADQPEVVEESIGEFSESLWEAIIIVLVASLFTLGRRSGYVISCCIPLILLGSFVGMFVMGIDLQKVSLGALVVSLGMLVDDAIVVVELMEVKMSEGMERKEAASYAFKTCARTLFTGTVITCLGFMPIAFSKATASDYAFSLFPTISVTLLLSWVVSATLAPVLGYEWIRPTVIKKESYDSLFYRKFRSALHWSLAHRWLVMGITLGAFVISIFLTQFVKQQFFPASTRPELLVELNLPEGSSIKTSDAAARKLMQLIEKDKDLDHVSAYVGQGAPRFVLVAETEQPRTNYAQLIVVAKDVKARLRMEEKIARLAAENLPEAIVYSRSIPLGPPAPYPVMIRVSALDKDTAKLYAAQVRDEMVKHPDVIMTRYDWFEKTNAAKLVVDNDKLLQMGITRKHVALALQAQISGASVAKYLEGDTEIDLMFRLDGAERKTIDQINAISIPTALGAVPLSQVAHLEYTAEDNIIWRRNLRPTVTVNAAIREGATGNDVTNAVYKNLAEVRKNLPSGVSIEIGGSTEDSRNTLMSLAKPVPAMILLIIILVMLEMQDLKKLFVIMMTAPLGIIGVILGLLIFNSPLGFMAELGGLALTGTIIRNSMFLVDQIKQHEQAGMNPVDAIVESSVVRFRPIMLAAFTTVLGLIPMFFSEFWNAMAVSISCGLTGATLLTLLVLPVMYALVFKIQK